MQTFLATKTFNALLSTILFASIVVERRPSRG